MYLVNGLSDDPVFCLGGCRGRLATWLIQVARYLNRSCPCRTWARLLRLFRVSG